MTAPRPRCCSTLATVRRSSPCAWTTTPKRSMAKVVSEPRFASPPRRAARWPASSAPPAKQGFTRNLTPAEIVAQVLHFSRERRVTNVVFMGMGEPLANYEGMIRAIRWLTDPRGLDMRQRGITVSTVGLIRPIERLTEESLQIGLTISLHAPDDELRRQLIPTAGGVTIDALLAAGARYQQTTGRRVTYAYALLEGVNDSPDQARALAVPPPWEAGPRQPDPVQPHRRRRPPSPRARARPRVPSATHRGRRQRHRSHRTRRRDRRGLRPTPHRRCERSPARADRGQFGERQLSELGHTNRGA